GLTNKMRAYSLQDTGLDTLDADRCLGFGDDERDFEVAARVLADLDVTRVRLMTNNPDKIAALERHGVTVVERHALQAEINKYNERYMRAKAERAGHLLDGLDGPRG
ncbi:MAG: GTP cyclohydrolase, partial [Alphaproteobacteria bacterium]|nr:GTP cyclohydrolase [Alphaproteobacteria bacterium]